jgi:hypothetical protein
VDWVTRTSRHNIIPWFMSPCASVEDVDSIMAGNPRRLHAVVQEFSRGARRIERQTRRMTEVMRRAIIHPFSPPHRLESLMLCAGQFRRGHRAVELRSARAVESIGE